MADKPGAFLTLYRRPELGDDGAAGRGKRKPKPQKVVTPQATSPTPAGAPTKEKAQKPSKNRPSDADQTLGVGSDGPTPTCDCYARVHRLLGNCVRCGKVLCELEGPGPCSFCGTVFMPSCATKRGAGASGEGKSKAEELKDTLLQYDRQSVKRTRVFDDQEEWYKASATSEVDGTWMAPKERKEKEREAEERRDRVQEDRTRGRRTFVSFDFAGRRVLTHRGPLQKEGEGGGDDEEASEMSRSAVARLSMPAPQDVRVRPMYSAEAMPKKASKQPKEMPSGRLQNAYYSPEADDVVAAEESSHSGLAVRGLVLGLDSGFVSHDVPSALQMLSSRGGNHLLVVASPDGEEVRVGDLQASCAGAGVCLNLGVVVPSPDAGKLLCVAVKAGCRHATVVARVPAAGKSGDSSFSSQVALFTEVSRLLSKECPTERPSLYVMPSVSDEEERCWEELHRRIDREAFFIVTAEALLSSDGLRDAIKSGRRAIILDKASSRTGEPPLTPYSGEEAFLLTSGDAVFSNVSGLLLGAPRTLAERVSALTAFDLARDHSSYNPSSSLMAALRELCGDVSLAEDLFELLVISPWTVGGGRQDKGVLSQVERTLALPGAATEYRKRLTRVERHLPPVLKSELSELLNGIKKLF